MSAAPPPIAFLDASVLYPELVRDILLRLASRNVFQPRWSARVQEEWAAALSRNRPDIPAARIARTRHLMDLNFEGAAVEGFVHRIAALALPDPDDRHVLAAAIHCGATVIVTANLRDFPAAALDPLGIEAAHPDAFIRRCINRHRDSALAAVDKLLSSYRNPPMDARELLDRMRIQGLVESAAALADTPIAHAH